MVGAFSRVRERMVTIVAPRPIFSPSGESRQNLSSNERKRFPRERLVVTRIATLRLVGIAPNAVLITNTGNRTL